SRQAEAGPTGRWCATLRQWVTANEGRTAGDAHAALDGLARRTLARAGSRVEHLTWDGTGCRDALTATQRLSRWALARAGSRVEHLTWDGTGCGDALTAAAGLPGRTGRDAGAAAITGEALRRVA